jgi:phosphatidylglycerol---prolipoprotein diacylglyceryl transferase
MHPILFKLGPISVHTYGFFLAMGMLAGIYMARSEAIRYKLDPDRIMDLCFYIIIAAIVGSRLFYVLTNFKFYISSPMEIFKIWNGGLVFYGGFIGAAIVVIIYHKIYQLPLGKTSDIAAVAMPLGHFFGRIGCFFAGCCYGKVCQMPWAVTFRSPDSLAPLNIALHPTQLYESAANLMVFLIMLACRPYKRFDGQLFLMYIILYGINRSIIEMFRDDFRGAIIFGVFSISQSIAIASAIISVIALIILSARNKS